VARASRYLVGRKGQAAHGEAPFGFANTEMPTFMDELRRRGGVPARALEFSILTAVRTAEALGARWSEIDIAEKIWTVPAERMKAGKEHRVPLSDAAFATLEKARQFAVMADGQVDPAAPVFPGIRRAVPLSPSSMIKLLKVDMGRSDVDGSWFPQLVPGLGRRAQQFPPRDTGSGAGARNRKQDRGGIQTRRRAAKTPAFNDRLGCFLRDHAERRGSAAARGAIAFPSRRLG
jgi:hypothetical protein